MYIRDPDYPNPLICSIDIVGHFDLVTKFNEVSMFFDENDPRYIEAWQKAMLKLLPKVKRFEINYGAVNKGLRSRPYLSFNTAVSAGTWGHNDPVFRQSQHRHSWQILIQKKEV